MIVKCNENCIEEGIIDIFRLQIKCSAYYWWVKSEKHQTFK